ncbi:hypothetical protein A2U01_0024672 [Trifolium medium]|uniref:Uncharacterized protein n=1 Tax=Trifolium medium TaxID=97028 RepID=A0A392NW13_9FABA|nr:hypothetical protein [Trifolium medium]
MLLDIITLAKELLQSQVSGHKEAACRTLNFITQNALENVRLTIAQDETIIRSIENLLQFPSSYTVSVLTLLPKIMSRVLIVKVMPFLNMLLQSSDTRVEIIDAGLVTTLLNASKANERCEDLKTLALSTISKITNQFGKVEDTQPEDEVTETAEDEVAESTADEDDINA